MVDLEPGYEVRVTFEGVYAGRGVNGTYLVRTPERLSLSWEAPASALVERPGESTDVRPVITVDPQVRFGHAHIRGIATDVPVGLLVAGDDWETVAEDYGLTRTEILLCCWFEAQYGTPQRRKAWRAWLVRHVLAFHRGEYGDIPLPNEEERA